MLSERTKKKNRNKWKIEFHLINFNILDKWINKYFQFSRNVEIVRMIVLRNDMYSVICLKSLFLNRYQITTAEIISHQQYRIIQHTHSTSSHTHSQNNRFDNSCADNNNIVMLSSRMNENCLSRKWWKIRSL